MTFTIFKMKWNDDLQNQIQFFYHRTIPCRFWETKMTSVRSVPRKPVRYVSSTGWTWGWRSVACNSVWYTKNFVESWLASLWPIMRTSSLYMLVAIPLFISILFRFNDATVVLSHSGLSFKTWVKLANRVVKFRLLLLVRVESETALPSKMLTCWLVLFFI